MPKPCHSSHQLLTLLVAYCLLCSSVWPLPDTVLQLIQGVRKCSNINVQYLGDPVLQPIRSFENAALVRGLYRISCHLNERVSWMLVSCTNQHRSVFACWRWSKTGVGSVLGMRLHIQYLASLVHVEFAFNNLMCNYSLSYKYMYGLQYFTWTCIRITWPYMTLDLVLRSHDLTWLHAVSPDFTSLVPWLSHTRAKFGERGRAWDILSCEKCHS